MPTIRPRGRAACGTSFASTDAAPGWIALTATIASPPVVIVGVLLLGGVVSPLGAVRVIAAIPALLSPPPRCRRRGPGS